VQTRGAEQRRGDAEDVGVWTSSQPSCGVWVSAAYTRLSSAITVCVPLRLCVYVCVRAYVRACVRRACVRYCVQGCVRGYVGEVYERVGACVYKRWCVRVKVSVYTLRALPRHDGDARLLHMTHNHTRNMKTSLSNNVARSLCASLAHAHTHSCSRTHTLLLTHTHTLAHAHTHSCSRTHTHACTHALTLTLTYLRMHTRTTLRTQAAEAESMKEGSKGEAITANEGSGVAKLKALLRTEKGKVALVCGGSAVAAGALLPCLPFDLRTTSVAFSLAYDLACSLPRLHLDRPS